MQQASIKQARLIMIMGFRMFIFMCWERQVHEMGMNILTDYGALVVS